MHKYFKAAGFSEYKTEESVYHFLNHHVLKPENLSDRLRLPGEAELMEYRLPLNEHIGICAAQLHFPDRRPELQYYYPYGVNAETSSKEACVLERHTGTETFAGMIDEFSLGLSLIFYVSNPVEYRKRPDMDLFPEFHGSMLFAFANEAKVLLPVMQQEETLSEQSSTDNKKNLIEAARNGDVEAIETLTASDMDMYHEISERMVSEDLYSVVEQTFMPCGIECDQYSIIGEIADVTDSENYITGEQLWILYVNCNGVYFRLCVRKDDMLGEPMEGRRIKCRLWMQGRVQMEN